jgi:inner membrane protein
MTPVEPLAHTLTGACFAESGLKRASPLAASTLIIAANLPDIDGTCYLRSADLAFAVRRGWSHGILAILVFPALLMAFMVAFDRLVRRWRAPELAAARPGVLLAFGYVGVISHILMDWPNSYGVRLLMPFSERWFYGDAVYIVDPWLWLVLGAAVLLSWSEHRRGMIAAVAIAAGTTLIMILNPLVPGWARAVWLVSIAAWLVARPRVPSSSRPAIAAGALVLAVAYIGAMIGGSRIAERQVRQFAAERSWPVEQVAAMPVPVEPFRRNVIVVLSDRYRFVPVNWLRGPSTDVETASVARGVRDADVDAALGAPFVQGVRRWLRFPSYEVRPLSSGGRRVIIRDARFAAGSRPGFGVVAIVDLDRQSQPRPGPSLAR